LIAGITFCWNTTWKAGESPARGSDQWSVTWADDDALYTCWGDGGGFGGSNQLGRASLGIGKLLGVPPNWRGVNVWGGVNPLSKQPPVEGKGRPCAIGHTLYVWSLEQGKWNRARLLFSKDHGLTWKATDFFLYPPLHRFAPIQYGKAYSGSPEGKVYGFFNTLDWQGLCLARVDRSKVADAKAYQVFAGLDEQGKPRWSCDVNQRKPVFRDRLNGLNWGYQAMYHPRLHRYLLTVTHGQVKRGGDGVGAGLGIFEAPEPWGPWHTVYFTDQWRDEHGKFCFSFPTKWISGGKGLTLWMIYSGWPEYDGYYHIKCRLRLRPGVKLP
jgi:hypothetical protein